MVLTDRFTPVGMPMKADLKRVQLIGWNWTVGKCDRPFLVFRREWMEKRPALLGEERSSLKTIMVPAEQENVPVQWCKMLSNMVNGAAMDHIATVQDEIDPGQQWRSTAPS